MTSAKDVSSSDMVEALRTPYYAWVYHQADNSIPREKLCVVTSKVERRLLDLSPCRARYEFQALFLLLARRNNFKHKFLMASLVQEHLSN